LVEVRDGKVKLNTNRCPICGNPGIWIDDLLFCPNCEDAFPKEYDFVDPKSCNHCGYHGDCVERFRYCPFDGVKVDEKLTKSWREVILKVYGRR